MLRSLRISTPFLLLVGLTVGLGSCQRDNDDEGDLWLSTSITRVYNSLDSTVVLTAYRGGTAQAYPIEPGDYYERADEAGNSLARPFQFYMDSCRVTFAAGRQKLDRNCDRISSSSGARAQCEADKVSLFNVERYQRTHETEPIRYTYRIDSLDLAEARP